jgi:hypothetical protein
MGLATLYGRKIAAGTRFGSDNSSLVTQAERASPGGKSARQVPPAPVAERFDSAGLPRTAAAAKFGCGRAASPVCGIRSPFVEASDED